MIATSNARSHADLPEGGGADEHARN